MKLWMTLVAPFALCAVVAAAQDAPAPAAMSLRDAVTYALAHSPELKASQVEVQRRQGLATGTRAALLPQVDLSADASRTRIDHGYPFGASPALLRFDTALYTGSADAKWLAWDFGRTAAELSAARERVESARAGVDRRRQELVFETARLYLETLAYTDLIRAGEARVASLQSLLDRTNQLVAGGRAVPVDALKIQTRLAEVESSLATLRSGRRSSLSLLASVMGFEGDLPTLTYSAAVADLPPLSKTAERDDLGAAAANRPDSGLRGPRGARRREDRVGCAEVVVAAHRPEGLGDRIRVEQPAGLRADDRHAAPVGAGDASGGQRGRGLGPRRARHGPAVRRGAPQGADPGGRGPGRGSQAGPATARAARRARGPDRPGRPRQREEPRRGAARLGRRGRARPARRTAEIRGRAERRSTSCSTPSRPCSRASPCCPRPSARWRRPRWRST